MKRCLKCNVDLPNIIVIDGKRHNICNRKFCLDCSPFKQHNTKNLNLYEEFYRRRNDTNCSTYCKNCTTIETTKRQRAVKQKAVNYLGGKCSICNYDKYTGALEFHHINPAEKDFNIAELKLSSFERIKPELDKCLLVCSNCHREIHGKIIEIPPRN